MTQNQIQFANYVETGRHNLASEKLGIKTLKETKRSNKAREKETSMHNRAIEGISSLEYQERVRSNKAQEANAITVAQISNWGRIQAAKIAAAANQYAADMQSIIADKNNAAKKDIQDSINAVNKLNTFVNQSVESDKNLTEKEKLQVEKAYKDVLNALNKAKTTSELIISSIETKDALDSIDDIINSIVTILSLKWKEK